MLNKFNIGFKLSVSSLLTSLLVLSCSNNNLSTNQDLSLSQTLSANAATQKVNRFAVSRHLQQDNQGFYYLPAGLCDDYPEESSDVNKIKKDLETLKAVGAKYLRFAFGWDSIEEEPGNYNWGFWDKLVELAPQYGVTLIPYVCYTPQALGNTDSNDYWREPPKDLKSFGKFMSVIAKRYKGKIKSWELWNEPDNQSYWLGTPDQFAKMMIEGAKQVRAADPNAVVVLGGMAKARSPFYDEMMNKYKLGQYFDVINQHAYHETWDFEPVEESVERIDYVDELIPKGVNGPDMWLAEFGYSNYRYSPTQASAWGIDIIYKYEHTAEYQGTMLLKNHILALASEKLSLMAWYRVNDLKPAQGVIGDDNNKFLGILDVNGKPKPAYHALKFYNQMFNQPTRLIKKLKVEAPAKSQSRVYAFEKKNGNIVVTGWLRTSKKSEVKDKSGMATDTRTENVSITLPTKDFSKITVYNSKGAKVKASTTITNGVLNNVTLTGENIFVAEISK